MTIIYLKGEITLPKFNVVNGVNYDLKDPDDLIKVLEEIREKKTRCKFYYGDRETGNFWEGVFDIGILGLIEFTNGKFLNLMYNSRSKYGNSLCTKNIMKIVTTKGQKVLYEVN